MKGSDDFHEFVQADSSVVTYRDFCVDCGRHLNAPCHSRSACPSTNERAARGVFGPSRPTRSLNDRHTEVRAPAAAWREALAIPDGALSGTCTKVEIPRSVAEALVEWVDARQQLIDFQGDFYAWKAVAGDRLSKAEDALYAACVQAVKEKT